jgi:HD superfamily phosphohydrolase
MQDIIRHLEEDYTYPIRDPIWKHIYLSDALLKLTSLPCFQELNNIKQLGPAYLVYPGATHTRLSHSLGTFHLAKRIITSLMSKTGRANKITLEEVKAFLCAALLHDLGHYPFAHSLKNLEVERHEALTAQLILESSLAKIIKRVLKTDPELVAAIIDTNLHYPGRAQIGFFRKLLSGVLDPDKLDYLNRDAYYCGVPYGIQDVDFFLNEIIPHQEQGIALSIKGLTAVETILFSKYLMYKTVYWHKAVRIATAMIKKALLLCLREGVLRKESLYGLTDAGFFAMLEGLSFKPIILVQKVRLRQLYKRVFSIPIEAGNSLHRKLEDLSYCLKLEARLAARVSKIIGRAVGEEEIIIDLPERISFEIDLPLYDEELAESVSFKNSRSVFSEQVVSGFTNSLRHISLIAARDDQLVSALNKMGPKEIFND